MSLQRNTVTIVVLAAGSSSRFGSNKLLHAHHGETLLARAIRACGSYPAVVVVSPQLLGEAQRSGKLALVNDRPDRGMTHSLRLANERIDRISAIAVLPADLLDPTAERVSSVIERARDADIFFPVRADGTPGHPVVFSPLARTYIDELADGDTIRQLRDHAALKRRTITIEEDWPYADVDLPSDLPVD